MTSEDKNPATHSHMRNPGWSLLPIPALLALTAVLYFSAAPSVFYDPGWLILIGNTLFVGVVSFVVCLIALRNYTATGRIQILLLGCGVLIFGIGGVVAAAVRALPGGANLNVTVYNLGALMGGAFHFAAAFLMLAGMSPEMGARHRRLWITLGYGGAAVFMALLTATTLSHRIPQFFVQGAGPTVLRQHVLGATDLLFVFSCCIFIGMYIRSKERFLYWYACALALTAISLTAFLIERSVGSPVGWAGRLSQYLAGVYFLIALRTAVRSAQHRGTSLDNVLTSALSGVEEKFRALAENSPDAIRRFDKALRHVYVNAAGLRLLGKPAGAVIGRTLEEAGLPQGESECWKERILTVFQTGKKIEVEDEVVTASGTEFFQSRCVPEYSAEGSVVNVLVLSRNLTRRKRAEEALRESERRFRIAQELSPDGFTVLRPVRDADGRLADFTWVYENDAIARMNGTDPKEVVGQRLLTLFPGHEGSEFFNAYKQVAETGEQRVFEAEYSGDSFPRPTWFRVVVVPMAGDIAVLAQDITGRKRQEQALEQVVAERTAELVEAGEKVRAERQRSLNMLDTLPVIIDIIRADHRIEWANRAYREAFGDNGGRLCYESQFGREEPCPECQAFVPLETGQPQHWEWTLPNGRTFDIHNFPFAAADGSPAVLEMDIDITERRRAEAALQDWNATLEQRVMERTAELRDSKEELFQTHQRLEALMHSLPVGVSFSDDATCQRITGNPAVLAQFEVKPGDNLSASAPDGTAPGRQVCFWRNGRRISDAELPLQRAVASGRVIPPMELEVGLPSGRHWFAEASGAPIRDREGNVVGGVAVTMDVTERKLAEGALQRASEQRRLALEAGGLGAWDYDFDRGEVFWDERCRNMFGIAENASIDYDGAIACIHADDRAGVDEAVQQALAGAAGGAYHREFRVVWPDGSVHWVSSYGQAYFAGEGDARRAVRLVGANMEITERKQAEERLRQAQKMESIGVLAGGIAHDFNNLLTSILGNASLVQMDATPGHAERLSAIIESSERAAALTRQLLAYAGKGQFEIADFDVARLVRSSADLIRVSIPKNIDLRVDVPRNLPLIRGDSSQIQQVIMNLVINAAEATEGCEHGEVSVGAASRSLDRAFLHRLGSDLDAGRYIVVTVRDNGCGIDEAAKAKIFDPFFTTKFAGRGLGLAAVHGILRSHKGAITVESRPGEGSTFTVYLPSSDARAEASEKEMAEIGGRPATVLVVDDEAPVRTFTKAALERLGYRIRLADHGRQALELLRSQAMVDIVVLDIVMPSVSGVEVFRELRRTWPAIPVLVASGYSHEEARRLGLPDDVPFIQKPYTVHALATAVNKALKAGAR